MKRITRIDLHSSGVWVHELYSPDLRTRSMCCRCGWRGAGADAGLGTLYDQWLEHIIEILQAHQPTPKEPK